MCNQFRHRTIVLLLGLFALIQTSRAQRYNLFASEVKTEYPSIVYDFLERYLYEIDSLQQCGENIYQRVLDDKVFFNVGHVETARMINPDMPFSISQIEDKYYDVAWRDTLGHTILDIAFPAQYELLLRKPKNIIEKELFELVSEKRTYIPRQSFEHRLVPHEDGYMTNSNVSNYYIESLNTAVYYKTDDSGSFAPIFDDEDKWHSAANLLQGCIDDISDYKLFIEQNLYGFNKMQYSITLQQWLAYCQSMQFTMYFAVEEELEDGLKALLVAQSRDLGFNHILSVVIPDDFVRNRKSVLKVVMNAYVPTHNVKDLYQQYLEKAPKKIL